jgi:hypothetical protein
LPTFNFGIFPFFAHRKPNYMLKRLLILTLVLLFASPVLFAQITTSSMSGTVKDNGGLPLIGATITAVHQPTGAKYVTVSQGSGQFSIADMRTGGPYLIEVSYVSYEKQKYDEIYLKLAENYILNVVMAKPGTVLENVIVSTQRRNPILNSGRTGAVTNLSREQIQRLPTITRSINDLTRTTPQSNGASIAGGNYRQNNFTIDGADFNNSFGIGTNLPADGSPISLDALDEISVNISPYDIRQSGFIGSAINAVTRSGTNKFTGSVYQYWRSEAQQGDKVEKTTFTPAPFNFKLYGFRVGGPIIKNKLFFFFNYETENQPKQVQFRVAASSTAPFGSAPNIARPTVDSLNLIRDYLQKTYGYDPGAYDNYSTQVKRTKYMGRLDWNIAPGHHFSVRYSQVEGGSPNPPSTSTSGSNWPGYPTGQGRTDINTLWFQNSNYFQGSNFYSFAAELTSRFGKRFSNVLRGTYTFQNDSRSSTSTSFPFVDILSGGTPYTSFGYEPFTFGNLRKVKMYSFVDNANFVLGKNNITAGVQVDWSQTINGFQRFGTSFYIFNSWNDFITAQKPVNFALTYSFLPGFRQAFPSFKFAQYSAYAQDEIAVNNKFRLTMGLRLDQPHYLNVEEIQTNPYILAVNFAGGTKVNTGALPKTTIMASPRVGFNYDIYGDRSMQIRGGTGIFTGKIPFVWIVSQSGDAGMLQTTQGYNGTANTPGPFNPDPAAYRPSTTPIPGSVIPTTIEALTKDYKFPQTWKSSLGIDKKLPWNMILTVEGIFNKDLKTPYFNNVNLVAPQPLAVAGYPDNRMIFPNPTNLKFINPVMATPATNSSVFVANGAVAPAGSSIQAANVIQMTNGTKGYYFSISAQLQKQFSRGFTAMIAYTKSIAGNVFDGTGDQPLSAWQATSIVNSPNTPVLGTAGYVLPDRLSAAITYRKEYFKHLGTTISLFYNGSIDGRFTYAYSGDFNRDGVSGNDLIYIPKDPTEITFSSFTYPNGVTYSPQQQSDLFFKYIDQDKYLRAHKGQYAERNGAQLPWRNQVDVKFMQDLFTSIGKNRNTFQFTLDIFNFGNLLNAGWGKVKTINASSVLVPTNQASLVPGGTVKPTFRLQTDRNGPVINTFRDNVSIISTYYMQFGIRYIFGN